MRYFILFGIFLLIASCKQLSDVQFIGEVVFADTDSIIVTEDGEKFVRVRVCFDVLNNGRLKKGSIVFVEYHVIRTNPDIESLGIGKDELLLWTFHKSNIYNVNATLVNGKYIESINSVQDLGIVQWAYDIGQ